MAEEEKIMTNLVKLDEPLPENLGKPSAYSAFAFNVDEHGGVVPTSSLSANYASLISGAFGGSGADGALLITSGTTTISAASSATLVKNYTSISITGTGALAFSTPNTQGTIIVLKSQGNVTLTSSAAPMLDASGMGGAGGAGGGSPAAGTSPALVLDDSNHAGTAGSNPGAGGGGGTGGVIYTNKFLYSLTAAKLQRKVAFITPGAGGGGGGGYHNNGSPDRGGPGGAGGGAFIVECGGTWTFTTASGISVNGANGSDAGSDTPSFCGGTANSGGGGGGAGGYTAAGANGGSGAGGGPNAGGAGGTGTGGGGGSGKSTGAAGGGGGACGMFLGLYNTLGSSTGTVTAAGGAGGFGRDCSPTTSQANGGAAGASDSSVTLIAQNNFFF